MITAHERAHNLRQRDLAQRRALDAAGLEWAAMMATYEAQIPAAPAATVSRAPIPDPHDIKERCGTFDILALAALALFTVAVYAGAWRLATSLI